MKVALIAPDLRVDDSYRRSSEHVFQKSGHNTGNFAFVHALWSHLAPHVELYSWHSSPDSVRASCDIVVMACANQLGPHSDLAALATTLEQIGLPILAIGLGAQAKRLDQAIELRPGTRRWLEVVAAHAPCKEPNIGVRGEFTRRQLERFGFADRAIVTGCPSNLLNPDADLGSRLAERLRTQAIERIAAPAGLHLWPELANIERRLADLVERTHGVYVAQSEIDMIRLARGEFASIEPATLIELKNYIRPDLSLADFRLWCKRYATCYTDAPSWMEAMRRFDFVVGPRFHGVMLALQAGVPGGVIAHDSRTLEMCETMCVPVRMFQDMPDAFGPDDLPGLFPFDGDTYGHRRTELGKRYVAMLEGAGIEPNKELHAFLTTAASAVNSTQLLEPAAA